MKVLDLIEAESQRKFAFHVTRMINAGYTGRNQDEVRKHIQELKEKGIHSPDTVPTLYPVVRDAITTDDALEVLGEETCGEAEFVILLAPDGIYIGVGSDHTDRSLEEVSIIKSKQICPNVMSNLVWRYDAVKDRWDDLLMRAWVTEKGQRRLYQEARLAALLKPEAIIDLIREKVEGDLTGMVIFSGTTAALGGNFVYGERFEVELLDEVKQRTLRCDYRVEPMLWFKGAMD
ncbi:MAG: DUF2848 domain-containing protein [Chloroflexi bacterium]|nr:DUF2848 domain-containing protein [Chloroflexota bacterium]